MTSSPDRAVLRRESAAQPPARSGPVLEPYLADDEPEGTPWQVKFFLAMAIVLVVEVVTIALLNVL